MDSIGNHDYPMPKRRSETREDAGKAIASNRKALDLTRMHDVKDRKATAWLHTGLPIADGLAPYKGKLYRFAQTLTTGIS